MLLAVLLVSTLCGIVQSSGIGHVAAPAGFSPVGFAPAGIAPAGVAPAPVVTAASSQYFERTFNRLVAPVPVAPPVPVATSIPVVHVPPQPQPPVFVPDPNNVPVVPPTQTVSASPSDPNVAIAIATAHAAAPVATILLPPYPFGPPPGFAFIPPQPSNVQPKRPVESTTPTTTTRQTEATTTEREPDTTPIPSNSDNSFVQALPSNQDVNFNVYGPPRPQHWSQQQPLPLEPLPSGQGTQQWTQQLPLPIPKPVPSAQPRPQQQPLPQQHPQQQPWPQQKPQQPWPQQQPQQRPQQQPWPQQQPQQRPQQQPLPKPHSHIHIHAKPQKLKTLVEVVKAPLAYIAPPPLVTHQPHRHIKIIKHVYGFVPESSARIIIRPVKIHAVKGPVRSAYKAPISARNVRGQNITPVNRNTEPTTFSPFNRPNTKPPRV